MQDSLQLCASFPIPLSPNRAFHFTEIKVLPSYALTQQDLKQVLDYLVILPDIALSIFLCGPKKKRMKVFLKRNG
jgi:hypothetical protein